MTTTATKPPTADTAQRRILRVLVASQILSGLGLAAGVTVGALLAQDMLGSTTLAGLPSTLLTGGAALTAVTVGRVSQRRGRRPGLVLGYLAGVLGAAGVIAAAVLDSPALLFTAMFVYGAGSATNLQARYAGADLAAPGQRARAVSTVLVATTLGGVAGPNLTAPTGEFAERLGIPNLAGPFLLSGAAYALAAAVLAVSLRPDPLLLARERVTHPPDGATPAPRERGEGSVVLGALVMVVTQLVMVAVMTMTPVHMHDHGHGTTASGLVIALHIAAMYLPSILTGRLTDRHGPLRTAGASALTLLAAAVLAATAPASSVPLLALALALLGLGWNLGLVSGTAVITDAIPLATRAKTQGLVDVSISLAGATGGLTSGLVVSAAGYPELALTSGVLALGLLPVIAATAYSAHRARRSTSGRE
ncbi:MFS transporter [Streptomyces roseirectus]|uniref:MFS transporter n=1 Tax=Streptomyces roseirectus TaxID=2768066 RepID=A0A7H0IRK3_9ACTN|nr:MFS transporter [Streptomyces roseirectus]QNP75419.1 MFS transporter [Streptomyces roseirectus]